MNARPSKLKRWVFQSPILKARHWPRMRSTNYLLLWSALRRKWSLSTDTAKVMLPRPVSFNSPMLSMTLTKLEANSQLTLTWKVTRTSSAPSHSPLTLNSTFSSETWPIMTPTTILIKASGLLSRVLQRESLVDAPDSFRTVKKLNSLMKWNKMLMMLTPDMVAQVRESWPSLVTDSQLINSQETMSLICKDGKTGVSKLIPSMRTIRTSLVPSQCTIYASSVLPPWTIPQEPTLIFPSTSAEPLESKLSW